MFRLSLLLLVAMAATANAQTITDQTPPQIAAPVRVTNLDAQILAAIRELANKIDAMNRAPVPVSMPVPFAGGCGLPVAPQTVSIPVQQPTGASFPAIPIVDRDKDMRRGRLEVVEINGELVPIINPEPPCWWHKCLGNLLGH